MFTVRRGEEREGEGEGEGREREREREKGRREGRYPTCWDGSIMELHHVFCIWYFNGVPDDRGAHG